MDINEINSYLGLEIQAEIKLDDGSKTTVYGSFRKSKNAGHYAIEMSNGATITVYKDNILNLFLLKS